MTKTRERLKINSVGVEQNQPSQETTAAAANDTPETKNKLWFTDL